MGYVANIMALVAPHWGAWIEIYTLTRVGVVDTVAPHWGAWIEIALEYRGQCVGDGRTPLGCVD